MPFAPRRALVTALAAALSCAAAVVSPARVNDVTAVESASGGVHVTARGYQGTGPPLTLALHYRINLGGNSTYVPMTQAGGVWTTTVHVGDGGGAVTRGAMFRFSVVAYSAGNASAELARQEGVPTVVSADHVQQATGSKLPILHWFVSDPEAARGDFPVACMAFFDARDGAGLRWYGNMTAHRGGSERHTGLPNQWGKGKSKDWPKTNFKFSFHHTLLANGSASKASAAAFSWQPGLPAVKTIVAHGLFQESGPTSYMRKPLALRFMEALGVPVASWRYIRLHQNGAFYGLYVLVEEVDPSFLARKGLDPAGPLFKADHWKYSNLRVPDLKSECPFTAPDYDYWPRGVGKCPVIFQEAGQPRGSIPGIGPLHQLALRVNAGNLEGLDMSAVVTEMAVQTAMLHQDRCTKNRYYHLNASNGRWTVIPYDLKDTFATDNRGDGRNCAAEGNPCSNTPSYCILSCEAFNSPAFCDGGHPQDTFPESDGRSTYNHLVDAVLKDKAWRTAYYKTLRYIMDNYLSTGWLQAQVASMKALIQVDAKEDNAKWHAGDIDAGVLALLDQMHTRRSQLYGTYGGMIAAGAGGNVTAPALKFVLPMSIPGAAPSPARVYADEDIAEDSSSSSSSDQVAAAPGPSSWRVVKPPPAAAPAPGPAPFRRV